MDTTTEESLVNFILGEEPKEEAADEETETAPQLDATDEDTGEAAPSEETEAEQEDVEEAEEEPDVPEQPDLITVKVNGVEKQVTLEELKRGYSGQEYVQQRMQEAAAKVKEAEQLQQSLAQERQAILALAQQMAQNGLKPQPKLPDPNLANTDPVKYIKEQAKYQQDMQAWQAQQAQIQAVQARNAQLAEAQRRQQIAENAERLKTKIPEFADPQKAEALKADLLKAGKDYGYSDADLMSITDARAVEVLRDAAQWRKLQAQKAQPVQPGAPKVVKPKAVQAQSPKQTEAKLIQQARKSQKPDDWANWLLTPTKT